MKRWLQLVCVGLVAGAMLSPMSAHADTLDENYSVPAAEPVAPASLTPPTTETYFTDLDGTTYTTKPTLLPAVEPATSTTSRASALPGDCAQVRQLIAEKKVSANALCWDLEEETPVATRNATIISDCRTMTPNNTMWAAHNRFYACYHAKRTAKYFRAATMSIETSIPIDFYQAVQLDPRSLKVTTASEAKIGPRQGATTVSISNLKFTTDACPGCSVVNSSTIKSSPSLYTSTSTMSVNSPGVNARREAWASLRVEVTAAASLPFIVVNLTKTWQPRGVLWECDTESIGALQAPGCVFGGVTGRVLFDGRTPENGGPMYTTAIHMSDAMGSGLPGKINSGKYLTRTNSVTIRDANRSAACPSSLVRPPGGYECDEFPFASTLEGGAANTKDARTFWYCKLSDPQRTGPLGFSRCMTPSGEGSFQGGALNSGYMSQRIRNGDKFAVGWSQV